MEDLINPDTEKLQNGITLQNGVVKVEIVRSMFDEDVCYIIWCRGSQLPNVHCHS